jgi:hypothetical protein
VDNFDDVQAAVAPVLREGIEFVRNRRIRASSRED